ncbi:hypothetical protein [Clostridium sporogenes]|nr:hypothetical protein [Clostridium sporogenes]
MKSNEEKDYYIELPVNMYAIIFLFVLLSIILGVIFKVLRLL